ncbi:MAG TPA: SufE family protein [Beijerinckiaceae bacterium]|nr:SufE family protein [Beijerinckiaceae bacterium]
MPSLDIEAIRSDIAFLDDWEERYRYIIDLGRSLDPLTAEEHCEATKVRGCASQVWLVGETLTDDTGARRLMFRGDSDAHIVKGLVALVIALFSGRTAQAILDTDAPGFFAAIGLKEHLTPQRSNGLAAMVERIRAEARAALHA